MEDVEVDVDVDYKIIREMISKKLAGRFWTGLISLETGSATGCSGHGNKFSGSITFCKFNV
jgi:hypothetical protein